VKQSWLRKRHLQHDTTNIILTRNTYCGTWYLPHSQVHNERTVPIVIYILYFARMQHNTQLTQYTIMAVCIAHARNGRISTSGLKYDVTVVFLDPDFLYYAEISAIRPQNGYVAYFHCACAKRPYFHFRSKM